MTKPALCDVVQNHMLQVLANLTMDPPTGEDHEALRDEKASLLKAIRPLTPEAVVRGQYNGYRSVPGVAAGSAVESFVAVKLFIDTWRWAGVPIFIRAGKEMPVTATEVVVEFKRPPREINIFRTAPPERNLPMLMGLLTVWYNNFFGAQTIGVMPYANDLRCFPTYLQQMQMESNGKHVDLKAQPVSYQTGPIIWGEPGTEDADVLPLRTNQRQIAVHYMEWVSTFEKGAGSWPQNEMISQV
jgi:hypothetical protein